MRARKGMKSLIALDMLRPAVTRDLHSALGAAFGLGPAVERI